MIAIMIRVSVRVMLRVFRGSTHLERRNGELHGLLEAVLHCRTAAVLLLQVVDSLLILHARAGRLRKESGLRVQATAGEKCVCEERNEGQGHGQCSAAVSDEGDKHLSHCMLALSLR